LGLSEEITVEHLLSRGRGGNDELNNLAIACRPCNNNRENHLVVTFKNPNYIAFIEHEQRLQVQYQLRFCNSKKVAIGC
jgi:5-methylcytosine-specific restriction endonuclease McrA